MIALSGARSRILLITKTSLYQRANKRADLDMLQRRRQSGFTLIEVLLVVVVMSIVSAVALTSYQGSQEDADDASIRYSLRQMRALIPVLWVKYDLSNGGGLPANVIATLPESPVTGLAFFTVINTDEPAPTDVNQHGFGGWIISSKTQRVWINHPDYVHY